ncbi:MAG: sigma-54 dependent transcriptional regulator [Longimicrobiales bacterium]|nr:sigma-54 dependent transcriptional regulator [Longimicrobiales bacterium]
MTASALSPALLALVPADQGEAVRAAARSAGFEAEVVPTLGAFLQRLRARPFAATLLSLAVECLDETVVARVSAESHAGALLLATPAVTLSRALLMERTGAAALLREPLDPRELAPWLARAADEGAVHPLPALTEPGEEASATVGPTAGRTARGGTAGAGPADDEPVMVGSGPAMAHVFQLLARVAPTPSTVLVTGESGTGKEVAARVVHWAGPRRSGPFVAVNCAAIPEHLLESELFGHERGAFTGAVARRVGRFERAHGGTLFLDEIGDMSLVLQAKILRVLEERRLERVGGEETVPVDVRIVAATNQALRERIAAGEFREDLYYRLAVVEVELPPLRERGDDLRALALHFAAEFAHRHGRPLRGVTEEALRRLAAHDWPGNVRELRNVMERAVLLATGDTLRAGDLRLGAGSPRTSPHTAPGAGEGYPPTLTLQEVEADYIGRVLASLQGHMGRTAAVLGIHRNTLTRKVQEYGLTAGGDGGTDA